MKKLRTNKSRNNLCGYYEKTPEEMEEIIYKLSTKDIKFLKEIYGEKLDGDISKGSLSQENRIKLNAILGRINKILSNGQIRTNKSRNNLCRYYEKTPEEMEEIIYKLSTKDINFLKEIYGEKLDGDISKGSLSKENRIKLSAILGRINKILSNGQIRTNKSRNNLCRYYEKTPEEMEEIIYKLSTKDINFLKEIYGEKLDGDIFKGSLSKENRIKLSAVLGRINKLLTTEIYCSNESVLKDEISLVKQLSISKIGLSESSSSQFEKMNKNDYEELKKILSIKNSKKVLSIEESLILILLFGFHKEKSFSIDDISRFLGEDPKIILEIEKRGIITLKEEINCIFNEVIKNKHNQKSLVLKNDD